MSDAMAQPYVREPTATSSGAEGAHIDDTGRWLLWITGAVAAALGAVAFLLWGTRSGPYILDLIAAICA